MIFTTV